MNERVPLERSITAWMADEAASGGSDRLLEQVLSSTGRLRPEPRWLALLKEPPMQLQSEIAVGTPARRLILITVLALLTAAVAAGVAGAILLRPRPAADDWPTFRGGYDRAGVAGQGPVGEPALRWRFQAGGPITHNVAIVDDLVLVPSDDGVLHALGFADGIERWSFGSSSSLTGPTIAEGIVYLTDGFGRVHGLDLVTGAERWRAEGAESGATDAAAGAGAIYLGTGGGELVALDGRSGAERWRTSISATGSAVHAPAYADGRVYAAADGGTFAAVDASTGAIAWTISTGADPTGTPVVAAGLAYVGSSPDATTGRLRAVDARTGATVWQVDEPLFSPSVAGSVGYSASSIGVVSARDTTNGTERWRFQASGTIRPPGIAGQVVYVAIDGEQRLAALDAATGAELWSYGVDGQNHVGVAISRGFVFVATTAGSVYSIGGDGTAVTAQSSRPPTSPATTSAPPPSPSASASVPDPISVVKSYDAASLGLDHPLALAVGPSGDIYVTDLSNRVTQIAPDGTVIRRWGGPGSVPGKFDFVPPNPSDGASAMIGVGPDGNVYVSDSDNHRIQVFKADGTRVRQFGSLGSANGQFVRPFDLSADVDGNAYVLDDAMMRLSKFSPDGEFIWAVDASNDPALAGHGHNADIDPQGRIVLGIDDTGTIVILSRDGSVVDSWGANACEVTVDRAGNFYVAGIACGSDRIDVYGPDHTLIGGSVGQGIGPLQFGPGDEVVSLRPDGTVQILKVTLPGP